MKNVRCEQYVSFATLAPKFASVDRVIKTKLKIMSLEVDGAYQTEFSMKAIRNGYEVVCLGFITSSPSFKLYNFEHRPFIYQRTSGVPCHINDRGRSVGVPAACRALCGLLWFTLLARPQRVDEVSGGGQTLLHRKKLPSCAAAAAVVASFAPLSYYYCWCSCSFSADRRESTSSVH